jgi:hypothetical protein
LGFEHPFTGEYLAFTDYLPQDLSDALHRLEKRTLGRTPAGEEVLSALAQAAARGGILDYGGYGDSDADKGSDAPSESDH